MKMKVTYTFKESYDVRLDVSETALFGLRMKLKMPSAQNTSIVPQYMKDGFWVWKWQVKK